MGVEGGVSVGSSFRGAEFGLAAISPIVNEGPVAPGSLENTMPHTIGSFLPVGEISFVPSGLREAMEVGAAKWQATEPGLHSASETENTSEVELRIPRVYTSEVGKAEPIPADTSTAVTLPVWRQDEQLVDTPGVLVVSEVEPTNDLAQMQRTQVALEKAGITQISQELTTQLKPATHRASERVISDPVQTPTTKAESFTETIAREEVELENRKAETPEMREEEGSEDIKMIYVEDERASGQRRVENREAIRKAGEEARKEGREEIEGWRIKKFMPKENHSNRSALLLEEDPNQLILDGSRVEGIDEVAEEDYNTEDEAIKKSDKVNAEKKPAKKAKEGHPLEPTHIARVRKFFWWIRSNPVVEIIIRSGRKPIETPVETKIEGRRIEDTELAEVFKVAA